MSDLLSQINQHQLTVVQLKDELRSRGAKVTGNKAELEDRLRFILTTGAIVPGQKGKKRLNRLEGTEEPPNQAIKRPPKPISPPYQPPEPELPIVKQQPAVKYIVKQPPPGKQIVKQPPPVKYQPVVKQNVNQPAPKQIKISFPPVPKHIPRINPKQVQKGDYKVPVGPVAPGRVKMASKEPPLNHHLQSIDRLKYAVLKEQLTVDQLRRELHAVGLPVSGTKKELETRLSTYLQSISLLDPVAWPSQTVKLPQGKPESPGGDIGPVFDQAWERTTEGVMQSLEVGDPVSFYDNDRGSYHTFTVWGIQRSPFGLADEIALDPVGYSLIRYKNQWTLFYQPQAGHLDRAKTFPVTIAARLAIQ